MTHAYLILGALTFWTGVAAAIWCFSIWLVEHFDDVLADISPLTDEQVDRIMERESA